MQIIIYIIFKYISPLFTAPLTHTTRIPKKRGSPLRVVHSIMQLDTTCFSGFYLASSLPQQC